MVTSGERGRGGMNQEFGINRYTLQHIKQIVNKDLLHSPGSSTQYSVIHHVRKGSEE